MRVSINTNGEIKVGLSGDFITPIGKFDISGGIAVDLIREEYANKVLVVRVDDKAVVYELAEGEDFKVNFDDSNTLYKKVALEQESDGDIILELVSVKQATPPPNKATNVPVIAVPSSKVTISCAEDITQASLRESPGYSNKDDTKDILYKVDCGETLQLLGESQPADGLTWWKVSWNSYTGWMADHTASGRTILLLITKNRL